MKAATAFGAARALRKAARPRERAFWIALACAVVAHAVLIAGFVRSLPQRQMGEKLGAPEGVSVAMVDAADLAGSTFAGSRGRPRTVPVVPPAAPPPPETPPAESPSQKSEARQTAPRTSEQRAPELVAPDEAARQADKQGKEAVEQKQDTVPWPIDLKALEQDFPADPPAKPRDPTSKQAAKEQQRTASAMPRLQLTLPDSAIPLEELFSYSRPAGITKSGENDEFGRGVIRALRKTFPDMGATRGRVTVRFLLSQDGNLAEVRLARSSGNPALDQAVLFAVQQSSFPFPPPNAPQVDRTFLVTYIYDVR